MGLDGVEIVMAWEQSFGIAILDQESRSIRTPRMATELICGKVHIDTRHAVDGCLCQRGFQRLRRACIKVLGCPRAAITPQTRMLDIVPREGRRLIWRAVAAEVGVPALPGLRLGFFPPFPYLTATDLSRFLVAAIPRDLLGPSRAWTRGQVREVVRAVVSNQTGIPRFSDDADFVRDLRVD